MRSVRVERAAGSDHGRRGRLADYGIVDVSEQLGGRLSAALCAGLSTQRRGVVRQAQVSLGMASSRSRRPGKGAVVRLQRLVAYYGRRCVKAGL